MAAYEHAYPMQRPTGRFKRAWTEEEDALLLECVSRWGIGNWNSIAEMVGRNQRRCRERWFNHLDGQCRKDPWTAEEDETIDAEVERIGQRWMAIAKALPPGRTGEQVKNRYKRQRVATGE